MLREIILFPPFCLDPINQQVRQGDQVLPLRPKLFAVLQYLVEHAGRLVTREEILGEIWPNTYLSEAVLRGYIRDLRTVLGDTAEAPRFIETVPRRGYRFLAPITTSPPVLSSKFRVSSSETQSSVLSPQHLFSTSPVVGRELELTQLHQWLDKARNGERHLVFVTGEPGIGKTALIEAFLSGVRSSKEFAVEEKEESQKSKVKGQKSKIPNLSPALNTQPLAPVFIGHGQCVEHYGVGEAYLPMLEALGRVCQQPDGEYLVEILRRHAPTWLVQMPALVSDAEFDVLQRKVQGAGRERMLREMTDALVAFTAEKPFLLVLEDLHWSDYSTLDLLGVLAKRREAARLLCIGTYRPTEVIVSGHPLRALKQELQSHGQCEELALRVLTESSVEEYLAVRLTGEAHDRSSLHPLARMLYRRTDGNPLFMVNVVDYWMRQGVMMERSGQWDLATQVEAAADEIPDSLRQMIEKQLERLTPEEQRVLEAASVAGGEFSTVAAAAGLEEPQEAVEEQCENLARREQFIRARGTQTLADGTIVGRYGFLHALYQHVLYERLAATRRLRLHRRIGQQEEVAYGARVREYAAELAVHFERGQDYERAIRHLRRAAENAMRRHAYHEAIALLTKGLQLLDFLPDTPERYQQEFALQSLLGAPLLMIKGYGAPEVERCYARARALGQQMGENSRILAALAGLVRFYILRAEFKTAREVGEQILHLARLEASPFLLSAHATLGMVLLNLGELTTAREHLEHGLVLYPAELMQRRRAATTYGDDPGVACLSNLALTLWHLGYPDQAAKRAEEALALARELDIPYVLASALNWTAMLYQHRREGRMTHELTETALALAREHGFAQMSSWGAIMQGWALATQGRATEGLEQMMQSITAYQATGAVMGRPWHLSFLGEIYMKMGRAQTWLALLPEVLVIGEKTGERLWEAELYRLKGELTLQQASQKSKLKGQKSKVTDPRPLTSDPQVEAEACFHKAIEIARKQQAKSLELRAVMSVSRLWQSLGKYHAARTTLSEVYNWFTEGFDTADLREAKILLAELA